MIKTPIKSSNKTSNSSINQYDKYLNDKSNLPILQKNSISTNSKTNSPFVSSNLSNTNSPFIGSTSKAGSLPVFNLDSKSPYQDKKFSSSHLFKENNVTSTKSPFQSPLLQSTKVSKDSNIYDNSPFLIRTKTNFKNAEVEEFRLDDTKEKENKSKSLSSNSLINKSKSTEKNSFLSNTIKNQKQAKVNKSRSLIKKDSYSDFKVCSVEDKKVNDYKNICSISYKTQAGKVNSFQTKTNQDSYLIATNILGLSGFSLFGVFDGHGTQGHLVSDYVKNYFNQFFAQKSLYEREYTKNSSISIDLVYDKLSENSYSLINLAFNLCENSLSKARLDPNMSGTTCVIVFVVGDKIICANAGDSRSILSTKTGIRELSYDHKPDNKDEKARILRCGGRVHPIKDFGKYVGPARVWVKSGDYPGLAMSRSIGDFVAKSVGCTCAPEIVETTLDSTCNFIVIGSDGVFEVMSNTEIENTVRMPYLNRKPEIAANILVDKAVVQWRKESDGQDDITALIIFFDY